MNYELWVVQSAANITPEAFSVNNAGIYPGGKEIKKQSEGLNVNNPQRSEAIGGRLITDRRLPFFGSRSKLKIFININMKKTTFFWMLTLIMMSAASVNAQVTIGSMNDPHRGAILDLSQSESSFGLLFPNVYLFNTHEFTLPADDGLSAKGMVIYNSNASLSGGAGLYAWNGSEWKSMSAGNANSCVPVTATATSEKTGNNAQITVSVTAGNPTFSYVWTKGGAPLRTATNVSATSDTYTTAGEGIYTVTVTNPCTATPVSFTFEVSGSGETLVDNGNGTKTDSQGNLVYKGETYEPVKSDVPGIYLDKNDEIVYTGADGIPGTPDDDVFVVPSVPMPKQNTLFSIRFPRCVHKGETYPIELDFAAGAYDGKIKYVSNTPDIVSVNDDGEMTIDNNATQDQVFTVAVILEDGSVIYSDYRILAVVGNNHSFSLISAGNTTAVTVKQETKKLGATLYGIGGGTSIWNLKSLKYEIENANGTGSTVTPGGWFHAGTAGVATVKVTATDEDDVSVTGTITVTILETTFDAEEQYDAISTNWAALDPAPAYAGGSGTEADPYLISSVRQLKKLSADIEITGAVEVTYEKYFELTTDLDFSADESVDQALIGTFYGHFNGKGHRIKNLSINATGKNACGIFSSLNYGTISYLGRDGGSNFNTVTEGAYTAMVAGFVFNVNHGGKLINCYNTSSFDQVSHAGGIVGYIPDGVLENCYNTGNITARRYSGGLMCSALNSYGEVTLKNCYNSGNVSCITQPLGGLIGTVNDWSKVFDQRLNMSNCFNFGDIFLTANNNSAGSIIGAIANDAAPVPILKVVATNVYSRPDVVSINGAIKKPNQPIGWGSTDRRDAVLAANPTLGENEKYTLDYSKTPAFAAELGDAFEYASGRTPKLAWE